MGSHPDDHMQPEIVSTEYISLIWLWITLEMEKDKPKEKPTTAVATTE